MKIGIGELVELARLARASGTVDAALDCAVQWAEGAHEEIRNLRKQVEYYQQEREMGRS